MAAPVASLSATMATAGAGAVPPFASPLSAAAARVNSFFHDMSELLHDNVLTAVNPAFQTHFSKSREAILKAAAALSGSCVVLGVGGAHDLPLAALVAQFDQVDLVDIDFSLIEVALKPLSADLRKKCCIHQMDLTGIWQALSELVEAKIHSLSHEDFGLAIFDFFQTYKRVELGLPKGSASFVISSLVSSQLNTHIDQYLQGQSMRVYGKPLRVPTDKLALLHAILFGIEASHMEDIASLVSPAGKVYFADHFVSRVIGYMRIPSGGVVKILHKDTILNGSLRAKAVIERAFNTLAIDRWVWTLPMGKVARELTIEGSATIHHVTEVRHREFDITALTLALKV